MPWTASSFRSKHYGAATGHAGAVAARAANESLARGSSEKMAVIAGIIAAKKVLEKGKKSKKRA
jgi:hypothetical protein